MRRQDIAESFRMALSTLRAHKFRSLLTLLGVVIGTMTVMVIGAFIAGLDRKFQQEIESFGTHTIFVHRFNPGIRMGNLTPEERMRKPIKLEDARAIREQCPSVEYVAPFIGPDFATVRYRDQELYVTQINGTTSDYERMSAVNIAQGRFFTEFEDQHRADVCVIGAEVADKFFPNVQALGKQILVDDKPLMVIGVLEKQENFFMGGDDGGNQNRAIYIPYWTVKKLYPQLEDHFLMIQARQGRMNEAIEEVRSVLRRRRGVPFDKEDNFGISTPEAITEQFHQITSGIAMLMIAISSVGLLIGGIGVMNIMLVSVVERTREIGLRKALGARRRDILWQFLIEAMTLTGSGGVLGIIVGWLLSLLVNMLLPSYVPPTTPVAGLTVSIGTGLIFGLWPAMKAARLNPIEALRYE
jgi:putative ABC transport system permease protein